MDFDTESQQQPPEQPKFDENAHVPIETEPDGCGLRCTSEWSYPGWFGIEEGGKTIDVPASFGPASLSARLIKLVMAIWFNASLIYKWWTKREHPAFFLSWLTNWAMILASIWLIVSFFNSIFPPTQPKLASDSVSLRVKISWILFTVACHFTLIVVILYWSLDYEPGVSSNNYVNLFTHVATVFVWPVGLIVDRYPIRWKHLVVPMFLSACYVAWLAIHQELTDIGNPTRSDNDPDTNDDLLYTAVDFEETPLFSSILVVCVVFVVVPLIHLLLWSCSLLSCPCDYSGRNRRYVKEFGVTSTSGENGGPLTNVNIYENP